MIMEVGSKTLLLIIFFISSAECHTNLIPRNITCLSCHSLSAPSFGCIFRNGTTMQQINEGTGPGSWIWDEAGQDLVPECHMCAIQDTWNIMTNTYHGLQRKLCLVSNLSDGCDYHYPVGTDLVMETCRCKTDLCNIGDITSLGGYNDSKKFPKPNQPSKIKDTSSSGNRLKSVGGIITHFTSRLVDAAVQLMGIDITKLEVYFLDVAYE